ncbi:hypothetical protein DXA61_03195 [Bacteroides intestinalis]|jgi:hypothetical protein|nr:hypothetical protein DXA61_03195 [Bacteroides intestinalis]
MKILLLYKKEFILSQFYLRINNEDYPVIFCMINKILFMVYKQAKSFKRVYFIITAKTTLGRKTSLSIKVAIAYYI